MSGERGEEDWAGEERKGMGEKKRGNREEV